MNENPGTAAGCGARAQSRGERAATAALSIGAVVLAVLLAVTGSGVLDRVARADMAIKSGGYTAMTTSVTTRELLFVIDDRSETLLVYDNTSTGAIELVANLSLPQTFTSARATAGGGVRRP